MKLTVRDLVTFGLLGALLYASKALLEFLPNVHLVSVLLVAITVVYRAKALYPLYVFVFLTGLLNGFGTWWIPYLYIWTVLWGAVMLLPRRLPSRAAPIVYMTVCGAHGLLFGTLYAPMQALLFHLNFDGMVAWIIAGLPFDAIHAVGNFVGGILIYPLILLLQRVQRIQ